MHLKYSFMLVILGYPYLMVALGQVDLAGDHLTSQIIKDIVNTWNRVGLDNCLYIKGSISNAHP